MSTPHTTCVYSGCPRPIAGVPWSNYCAKHAMRIFRNGSPDGRSVKQAELKLHREPVARALARYQDSDAVKAALLATADVLTFRPQHEFTYLRDTATQLGKLVNQEVTPREVLQRTCEVWALSHFNQRFESGRELHHALAWGVLKLRPLHKFCPSGHMLRFLGGELQENLGRFAAGLCLKIEADSELRAKAKKAFETGWTLKGEE